MVEYRKKYIGCFSSFVYIGFNKFMEDIRMMLDRRPFESYWFFTWCISGPIITLVSKRIEICFVI